jgi:hypothetical protein
VGGCVPTGALLSIDGRRSRAEAREQRGGSRGPAGGPQGVAQLAGGRRSLSESPGMRLLVDPPGPRRSLRHVSSIGERLRVRQPGSVTENAALPLQQRSTATSAGSSSQRVRLACASSGAASVRSGRVSSRRFKPHRTSFPPEVRIASSCSFNCRLWGDRSQAAAVCRRSHSSRIPPSLLVDEWTGARARLHLRDARRGSAFAEQDKASHGCEEGRRRSSRSS